MIRLLYTLLLIIGVTSIVQAQRWKRVADWGLSRRMCAVAFTWNGKGYVGFGHDFNAGACFKDIGYYDPVSDVWGEEAYLELAGRTGAFCFCYKNLLYFGGGTRDSGKVALRDFYIYNLEKNARESYKKTCDTLPDLPFSKAFGARAVLINDTAYVIGGCATDSCEPMLWAYIIKQQQWIRCGPLPVLSQFGYAFALRGKLYCGGGNDNSGVSSKDFQAYDPASGKWTKAAHLPGVSRTMGVGVAINDSEAIVGTGFDVNGYYGQQASSAYIPAQYGLYGERLVAPEKNYLLSDFYRYNAATDKWKKMRRLPDARRNACAFVLDGYLYIATGNSMDPTTKSTFKIKIADL